MSDYEDEVDVKPTKKQMTEAQRKARLENLRKGRQARAENVNKKKAKLDKQSKTQSYEVRESDSDSDSDSDSESSEEELVLAHKSKVNKSKSKSKTSEIDELKAMVAQLAKDRLRKKKTRTKKTIINVQTPSAAPVQNNKAADFYKSKLLDL